MLFLSYPKLLILIEKVIRYYKLIVNFIYRMSKGEMIIVFKTMRKLGLLFFVFTFLLSGCIPKKETEKQEVNPIEKTSIIAPNVEMSEQYYRGVLPYKPSSLRGVLGQIPNRLDSKAFELGLLELAKTMYDPMKLVFQEGQILKPQNVQFEDFLVTINEHDYLSEDGNIEGIVIGLLVSPNYYAKDESGAFYRNESGEKVVKEYSDEELEAKAKRLIVGLTSTIRQTASHPSILFGVMKAQTKNMMIPGNFFLVGKVNQDENKIGNWNNVNESYLFLPNLTAIGFNDQYGDVSRGFNHFKKKMDEYLPGYAGITGLAKFSNNDLTELTIRVYTEFDSTVELIQFIQFGVTMTEEYFSEDHQINLYVYSMEQPKGIYVKKANGESFMHIFRD